MPRVKGFFSKTWRIMMIFKLMLPPPQPLGIPALPSLYQIGKPDSATEHLRASIQATIVSIWRHTVVRNWYLYNKQEEESIMDFFGGGAWREYDRNYTIYRLNPSLLTFMQIHFCVHCVAVRSSYELKKFEPSLLISRNELRNFALGQELLSPAY